MEPTAPFFMNGGTKGTDPTVSPSYVNDIGSERQ